MKTVYKNVDEFIEDMRELVPMLEQVKRVARMRGDKSGVKNADKVLELFANDAYMLREVANKVMEKDGSIQFSFTQDAWNLFLNHR